MAGRMAKSDGASRARRSARTALAIASLLCLLILLIAAGATGSTLAPRECIDLATARPQITRTEMRDAGVPGVQSMYARVTNLELPEECGLLRIERFMFKVQNPKHRARWVSMQPGFFTFKIGNDGGWDAVYLTASNSGRGLYRCTPGHKATGAEVAIRVIAQDPQTHKPLRKRTYTAPIARIWPHRC